MSGKTYAFIDSQNLHLGTKTQGWRLDYKKFRVYLKDKYNVKKAFLFIGYISKYKNLYKKLSDFGYELIFKPTTKIRGSFKGNIDAELVLYSSAIEIDNYNKAIIISGDGDFYCLAKFLLKKNKLDYIFIPNRKAYSHLLNDFYKYLRFVDDVKSKIKKGDCCVKH
jgi:uncharacterized LabA/DUF88 family protein